MESEKQKTCASEIGDRLASRLEDLELFEEYNWQDLDELEADFVHPTDASRFENIGSFNDYGLCFDYVEPGTWENQAAGYYRYQLSWGGPSDEFQFYGDGRIEYRFMDWGDGARLDVTDNDTIKSLARYFQECEMMPKFDGLVKY